MLRDLMNKDNLEKKIEKNQKLMEDLLEKVEEVDQETSKFFTELDISPDDITELLSKLDETSAVSKEKKEEVEKARLELENYQNSRKGGYRDISSMRKAYKERGEVKNDWLFIR